MRGIKRRKDRGERRAIGCAMSIDSSDAMPLRRSALLSAVVAASLGTCITSAMVNGSTLSWVGNVGTDWDTPTNWSPNVVPPSGGSIQFGTAGTAGTTLTNTLTSSSYNISTITFNAAAPAYFMNGNTFTLTGGIANNSANPQTFSNTGGLNLTSATTVFATTTDDIDITTGLTNSFAGVATLTSNGAGNFLNLGGYTLGSGVVDIINGSGNVSITGPVVNGGSSASGLTYSGSGTLTLSGANTFTGAVNLNGGTVQVDAAEVSGATPSGPLGVGGAINFAGGTLQYSAANSFDYSSRFGAGQAVKIDTNGQNVTFASLTGTGSLTLSDSNGSPGSLTVTATNGYTGTTSINTGGSLVISSSGTATASYTGVINVNSGGTVTLNTTGTGGTIFGTSNSAFNGNNAGTIIISGTGSGATQFNEGISGAGTIILNNPNSTALFQSAEQTSFSGNIYINAGTLETTTKGNVYDGSVILNAASNGNATLYQIDGTGYSNPLSVTGAGNNLLDISGTGRTFGGPTTLMSANLSIQAGGGSGSVIFSGNLSGSGNVSLNASNNTLTISGATFNPTGSISTTGSNGINLNSGMGTNVVGLTQASTGTTIVNGTNGFSGNTTISNGTLSIGTTGSLASNTIALNGATVADRLKLLNANALSSSSTISVTTGAVPKIYLDEAASTVTPVPTQSVFALLVNGTAVPAGVYSSTNEPSADSSLFALDSGFEGTLSVGLPEPSSAALLGFAAVGMLNRRRRRI
jgi:fibronectin-binding autotransporter adhesin